MYSIRDTPNDPFARISNILLVSKKSGSCLCTCTPTGFKSALRAMLVPIGLFRCSEPMTQRFAEGRAGAPEKKAGRV